MGQDGKLTDKGKLAVAADKTTESALRIMSWARRRFGSELALENPQASLQMRPYMMKWEREQGLTKYVVHYCAYGHVYNKSTNIWTTRQGWTPEGKLRRWEMRRRRRVRGRVCESRNRVLHGNT